MAQFREARFDEFVQLPFTSENIRAIALKYQLIKNTSEQI